MQSKLKCKKCGSEIVRGPKANNVKYCQACRAEAYKYTEYRTQWQRDKRDREASIPSDRKVQCLICSKWYIQVCTHVLHVHGIGAREYREMYDLEVKRGVVPPWYRELKGDQALENGTVENLKKGAKYRFVKGDLKAGKYKRSQVTIERLKNLSKKKNDNI